MGFVVEGDRLIPLGEKKKRLFEVSSSRFTPANLYHVNYLAKKRMLRSFPTILR